MNQWVEFLPAAREAAGAAGALLRRGLDEAKEIGYKGAVDLVTNFDRLAQELIVDRLSAAFPGHAFLAEEGLRPGKEAEFLWVIDPLDGTTNFAHRLPVFAVSIGLVFQGAPVAGVVLDPIREDMFTAAAGAGAFLGSRRIHVSGVSDLDRSLLATGFPYDIRESPVNNLDHFRNFCLRAQAVRRCGSAALDLCYLACGRFDGFWELKLKPWDVAAGALIVIEAGGRVTDLDGGKFRIDNGETVASNGLIHDPMLAVLRL
ncbi:MAG: inositol monophosphatase, partial [Candidatus Aminicenantes bacterium RBG_16_63_16]